MEKYIIPTHADQPTNIVRTTRSQAGDVRARGRHARQYPSQLDSSVPVGRDPLAPELTADVRHGAHVYGMHWLLDVDNMYGFGTAAATAPRRPSYINTFQRGPQESVWETVPQPSCDDFKYGGKNGYLDLFVKRASPCAKQWKYTDAPDADARADPGRLLGDDLGRQARAGSAGRRRPSPRAAKMGDYLRYAMFDKYFKKHRLRRPALPGRHRQRFGRTTCCPGTTPGAARPTRRARWAWRIGSSSRARRLPEPAGGVRAGDARPTSSRKSPNAARDWQQSLDRQLEFYQWLQSAEGAIAGGATNSWDGRYATAAGRDADVLRHGLRRGARLPRPAVNQWFGFQAWSMERVAEYYYVTGDARAKAVLDKWVAWAMRNTTLDGRRHLRDPVDARVDRQAGRLERRAHDAGQAGTRACTSRSPTTATTSGVARRPRARWRSTPRSRATRRRRSWPRSCSTACGPSTGQAGRHDARDARRLQALRRRGLRPAPAGPARCPTAIRSTRRDLPQPALQVQERSGLVEGRGLPEGRRRRSSRTTGSGRRRTSRSRTRAMVGCSRTTRAGGRGGG